MGALAQGGDFIVTDTYLLQCFEQSAPLTLQALWQKLAASLLADGHLVKDFSDASTSLLQKGSLAKRLVSKLGPAPDKNAIVSTWQQLATCLQTAKFYE